MKRLLNTLRDAEQPPHKYVLKAVLISIIPSVLIAIAVHLIFKPKQITSIDISPASLLFGAVLIGPWLETLLMIPILWILKRFFRDTVKLAIASAAIWALLHSAANPTWGLAVVWVFFVLSLSFLGWEKKSTWKAVQITASIHMCQNLFASLLILLIKQ